MSIEKKKFVNYGGKNVQPIAIKLNEYDELMLQCGMYVLNMDSKSGVFKLLAHTGLKVILSNFGAKTMHYISNGERRRYMRERPDIEGYLRKGNGDL